MHANSLLRESSEGKVDKQISGGECDQCGPDSLLPHIVGLSWLLFPPTLCIIYRCPRNAHEKNSMLFRVKRELGINIILRLCLCKTLGTAGRGWGTADKCIPGEREKENCEREREMIRDEMKRNEVR